MIDMSVKALFTIEVFRQSGWMVILIVVSAYIGWPVPVSRGGMVALNTNFWIVPIRFASVNEKAKVSAVVSKLVAAPTRVESE